VLGKGRVLQLLYNEYSLPEEFLKVYSGRYEPSISFINKIIDRKSLNISDEFYVSHLTINELFSTVRDELRSIILFNKGIPISMWRNPRFDPEISEDMYQAVYQKMLQAFIPLFEESVIELMVEQSPQNPNYWDVCSSILFLIKEAKTHDATLLTSAILDDADYFVTLDSSLIKNAKKLLKEKYELELVNPKTAIGYINRTMKKNVLPKK